MTYPIVFSEPPSEQDAFSLLTQLRAYNSSRVPETTSACTFGFFIKENGEVIGGLTGQVWAIGLIRVDRLFLQEKIRSEGYGKKLLDMVENYAREKGAVKILLETFSFQEALNFYLKLGYNVIFQEDGFAHGAILYHLRKSLV